MKTIYNGIVIPDEWPPRYTEQTLDEPLPVPYLQNKPEYVDISIGRQLFVDDFLIEETNLERVFHKAEPVGDGPIFKPETSLELNGGYCPCASPFNDGVFFDPDDQKFKMWYQAGWFDGTAYAQSDDGVHWSRLSEIFPGESDRVIPYEKGALRDGSAVWLDCGAKDPGQKFKMLVFYRKFGKAINNFLEMPKHYHDKPGSVSPREEAVLYRSHNGIDWREASKAGVCGDNTTFFYNPFTRKWVFSLRTFSSLDRRVRTRGYVEADDFFSGSGWREKDIRFWARTDIYDEPSPLLGHYPQLYNLDATPYESLMLGVFGVFLGPPNFVCESTGAPKLIDLKLAYSRDGFHWHRPAYDTFIGSSGTPGKWDNGYIHPAGGVCLVVHDKLYFYFSAWSGVSPKLGTHMYSGGSMGLAVLRRDGFASLRDNGDGGSVLTPRLRFDGCCLFVNASCSGGHILAEIIGEDGTAIPGFAKAECIAVNGDGTKQRIRFEGGSLRELKGQKIRIRFHLKNASLYSFWIAKDEKGHSGGYMAAGGPGFYKGCDMDGRNNRR